MSWRWPSTSWGGASRLCAQASAAQAGREAGEQTLPFLIRDQVVALRRSLARVTWSRTLNPR